LKEAIENLDMHRLEEGRSLESDLLLRISNIRKQQEEIAELELSENKDQGRAG